MICVFFGNRDTPDSARNVLYDTVSKLITERNAVEFYVGNNGNFDRLVLSVLKELNNKYPYIKYYIVYAYLPQKDGENFLHTIYPEGIENVPKRFAIDFRNKWMLTRADIIVTYIRNKFGNSYKLSVLAAKKGKTVINIYQNNS